jgi:hypothetical protein
MPDDEIIFKFPSNGICGLIQFTNHDIYVRIWASYPGEGGNKNLGNDRESVLLLPNTSKVDHGGKTLDKE